MSPITVLQSFVKEGVLMLDLLAPRAGFELSAYEHFRLILNVLNRTNFVINSEVLNQFIEPVRQRLYRVSSKVEPVNPEETVSVALKSQLPLNVGLHHVALMIADIDLFPLHKMMVESVVFDHDPGRPLFRGVGQQEIYSP